MLEVNNLAEVQLESFLYAIGYSQAEWIEIKGSHARRINHI